MGQTCCTCKEGEASQHTTPNTIKKQPQKERLLQKTNESVAEPGQLPESQQKILDNMELKQLSMDLLKESKGAFVKFAAKHLEKILNKVWPKVDVNKKGYIETSEQIAETIGFIVMVYKGSRKQKPKKQEMLTQIRHIATWIVTRYGQKDANTANEEYVLKLTRNEFQNNINKWMVQYVESDAA
eukprot:UN05063